MKNAITVKRLRRRDKRYKRITKQREREACGVDYWQWLLDFFPL